MTSRKMLSRRQCVFVIVVLPMLIIPAMIILKHADNGLAEVFIPPKRDSMKGRSFNSVHSSNLSAVQILKRPPPKLLPRKCLDYIWTGTCHDTCFTYNVLAKRPQRKQQTMKCDKKKSQLKSVYTKKPKYIFKTSFQDPCLKRVVEWVCSDGRRVPNIVHYVWFGKHEFKFINFLSFLSVHKYQKPCMIMLHADKVPKGPLWVYFLQISPLVVHVHRKQPKKIFKKKIAFVEHKADVAKLEALKEYGGIYLDTDQVLLKSLNKFRNNDATIGLDYGTAAANSIVLAKKNAIFIKLWYETYRTFTRTDGNKHSQDTPYRLAEKHRSLVMVARDILSFPNAHQLTSLYSKNVPFDDKFGMHLHDKLHSRFYKKRLSIDSIRNMNTTFGSVARYILYGNTELCGAKTLIQ
ncbi:hypothetical protein ACF0H5_014655 [Mactra antiquata]